jgi:hypothetical protein
MEGEDIAPYQDEDSRLHRAWLQSNASANIGEGMGSEPGSGSPAARRARGDPFEFDEEFFLLLVILEAANHGEAVEHVGVGEIVDIEGEQEGDQAQAVPLVYMHPLVGSTCHHDLRHGGHQDHIALHVMYLRLRILMNDGN